MQCVTFLVYWTFGFGSDARLSDILLAKDHNSTVPK